MSYYKRRKKEIEVDINNIIKNSKLARLSNKD